MTGNTVLVLADAIRRRHRIRVTYRAFSGDETRRELSPYGLVVHSGRWYLAAHDHLRDDLRTFRIDRMLRLRVTNEAADEPSGRLRRRRVRADLPRARAVGMGGRGRSRAAGRRGAEAHPGDARRACRRGRRDGAPHACGLARLGCDRARGARLRLLDPAARRAPCERPGPRRAARELCLGASLERVALEQVGAVPAHAREPRGAPTGEEVGALDEPEPRSRDRRRRRAGVSV